MFRKILIANRGEIACRIIRSCKRLDIATVAIHSDADAEALHVRLAGEAVAVGPAAASRSYLSIDAVIEACRQSGAEAVHPGYGFLSENGDFIEAVEAAGIVFIGPPSAAVRAMGDKITSKRLAEKAGVNTIPGHPGPVEDVDEAQAIAQTIGYPLMIKAAAGGGGKGMRVVHDGTGLAEGLKRTRSEAKSAFGDARVFLEKFVTDPRHIEIQVLADGQGNIVHLFERECSVQRRHQKVIEEAPSPFLDDATRRAMGAQAVRLAERVGYVSAGTVEFVVDADCNFYFLEMNTRLQVEHPVTECVTGIDLVEQMIRIAAGEALPFRQDDLRLDGWAMEARLYAEDPARGFLPSTGRLRRYREPEGQGIRIDSGVDEGSEISVHYDPMIAKVIADGPDRETARSRLSAALEAFVVRGPETNASFLTALLNHPNFVAGDLTTNFIDTHFSAGASFVEPETKVRHELAAIAVAMQMKLAHRASRISGTLPGWIYCPDKDWCVLLEAEPIAIRLEAPDTYRADGEAFEIALDWRPGELLARAVVNGRRVLLQADPLTEGFVLRHRGAVLRAIVRTQFAADLVARMPRKAQADRRQLLTSPMPGQIVSIAVAPGDTVEAGQELCVLEAMKMENVLRAEGAGVIDDVRVQPRDNVQVDDILLTFKEPARESAQPPAKEPV